MMREGDESFDPYETISGEVEPAKDEGHFDPFQSIQGDDAFVAHFPDAEGAASAGKIISPLESNLV